MAGDQMKQRRDTAQGWITSNRTLGAGEFGLETDTRKIKFGDGTTPWTALQYIGYVAADGKAANSDKLDGYDSSEFVLVSDVSEAATATKVPRRTADGGLRITPATDSDEAVTLGQLTAARTELVSRTVTTAGPLATGDAFGLVMANNASSTTPIAITVPSNTAVPFAVGTIIDVCAPGVGWAVLTPDSGVTIRGELRVFERYGVSRLLKTAANDWLVLFTKGATDTAPTGHWRRVGAGNVPNNVFVPLTWDTEDWDTHAMWDSGSVVTIRRSGIYTVSAGYGYVAAAGRRAVRGYRNSTGSVGTGTPVLGGLAAGGTAEVSVQATDQVSFSSGDTLTIEIYQDSGSAQNTQDGPYCRTFLSLTWLRPSP